jgi:hypothetical protein
MRNYSKKYGRGCSERRLRRDGNENYYYTHEDDYKNNKTVHLCGNDVYTDGVYKYYHTPGTGGYSRIKIGENPFDFCSWGGVRTRIYGYHICENYGSGGIKTEKLEYMEVMDWSKNGRLYHTEGFAVFIANDGYMYAAREGERQSFYVFEELEPNLYRWGATIIDLRDTITIYKNCGRSKMSFSEYFMSRYPEYADREICHELIQFIEEYDKNIRIAVTDSMLAYKSMINKIIEVFDEYKEETK